jgi:hypothetical protein
MLAHVAHECLFVHGLRDYNASGAVVYVWAINAQQDEAFVCRVAKEHRIAHDVSGESARAAEAVHWTRRYNELQTLCFVLASATGEWEAVDRLLPDVSNQTLVLALKHARDRQTTIGLVQRCWRRLPLFCFHRALRLRLWHALEGILNTPTFQSRRDEFWTPSLLAEFPPADRQRLEALYAAAIPAGVRTAPL